MARRKTAVKKSAGGLMTVELEGICPGEKFPDGYFGGAPRDIFGPRSILDPLEDYSPCYMADMFGAGLKETLHRTVPPRSRLWPQRDVVHPAPAAGEAVASDSHLKEMVIYDPHDDRVVVPNTMIPPFRSICRLETLMTNGSVGFGTGWFAAANIVVTAGHCLYGIDGTVPAEIHVTPGLSGSSAPYRSQISRLIRVPRQWYEDHDDRYDYGIIILPDKQMGNQTGWFGFASTKDSHLPDLCINSLGYPEDHGHVLQVSCPGRVRDFDMNFLRHDVDTVRGQSGSPIFHKHTSGARTVIGIHTDADGNLNAAVRITSSIFKQIRDAIDDNA